MKIPQNVYFDKILFYFFRSTLNSFRRIQWLLKIIVTKLCIKIYLNVFIKKYFLFLKM